jgi:hypothetical protein
MTIKSNGGVFGRNPSFNDVEANSLDVSGPTTTGSPLSVETTGVPFISMLRKFTPSAPAFGLGVLDFKSYSTGTTEVAGARVVPRSEGAWSGSSAPTSLVIQTVNFGSTSLSDKVTIKAAGDVQLNAGNLVVANGKGIDFSATSGTGTSELFDDYEEGTFTPTDISGASLSLTVYQAYYTKIGRVVYAYLDVAYQSTADANTMLLSLPFAPTSDGGGSIGYQNIASATQIFVNVSDSLNGVRIVDNSGNTLANSALSGKRVQIMCQYNS